MGVGRFLCVSLPFILTLCSLLLLLVACLGGVADKNLHMFRVNITALSINPASLSSLVTRELAVGSGLPVEWHDRRLLGESAGSDATNGATNSAATSGQTGNITAADLGLSNLYDIGLWGYCAINAAGEKTCTQPKFDWAASFLNTSYLENFGSAAGRKVTLPKEIKTALQAFNTVTKWTEVAFIIALVSLGVELFFGIFATCSRAWSCVTYLISGVATFFVIAAASLATTMVVVVVGTVEGTAKWYGVASNWNVTFLSLIWLSAAFAIGAGLFWLFTVCCCKPEHRSKSSKRHSDGEKLLPANAYRPISDPDMTTGYYSNAPQQYGAPRYPATGPRTDIAYEPYSHRA
jgi:hypothetical protein